MKKMIVQIAVNQTQVDPGIIEITKYALLNDGSVWWMIEGDKLGWMESTDYKDLCDGLNNPEGK